MSKQKGFKNISAMMAALAGLSGAAAQSVLSTPVLKKDTQKSGSRYGKTAAVKRAAAKKRNIKRSKR